MAKVLTGISGNLISAASAGFAPTNSADVSAIASAYQVVSSTATQLYAGTAYVTSVNDAPLSASRAGNAANASLASSAWYDGTGRLISSLPDSAAVSAIASAYAESAASGKLDYSAVGIDSEMMVVSSIDDIYVSAWIAGSAEHWSGASGKQDTLSFSYDDDKISAINGSALAGQGGGSVMSPSGTIIVTDGTAIEATNSAIGTAEGFEVNNSSQANGAVYSNTYEYLNAYSTFKSKGIGLTYNSSNATRTAWVSANTDLGDLVSSFVLPASSVSAAGLLSTSNIYSVFDSILKVDGGSLTLSGSYPVLFVTTGEPYSVVKELAWASDIPTYSYDAEDKISAINGSAIAGGAGGVDSATVSAIASSYVESGVSSKQDTLSFAYNTADQISSINGSALGGMDEAAVSGIASAYAESAASSKLDSSASSSFYSIDNPSGFLTTAYTPTFGYNTADQISSIDGSALGGMDEAAVSGIASAYAESAISAASGNYYPSTSNPSGYLTAQAQASWSESASASPSYIQDKPDLVDIVAGPGIVIDNPDGNTLRVSTDENYETVLWSGSANQSGPFTLNEAYTNFQYVQIKYQNDSSNTPLNAGITKFPTDASQMKIVMPVGDEEPYYKVRLMTLTFSSTSATVKSNSVARYLWNTGGACSVSTAAAQAPYITEIVGIHRIANN